MTHYLNKQVIFIRHGEKKKGIHLSDKGIIRSNELVNFFVNKKNPNINIPDIIIAMRQHKNSSNRAIETVKPLSIELNINIIHNFYKNDIIKLYSFINDNLDKNILVCWEHKKIIDIVKVLTYNRLFNLFWKRKDYISIWIIANNTFNIFNQFKITKKCIDYSNFKTEPIFSKVF